MKWPLVKISDFCQTGSGGTPSREVSEYYQGDIPWIKSGDLRENIVTSATEFISNEAIQKSSAKIVPRGAILVAMYGATVGRMALLGIDAATNQAVCYVVPNPSKADTKYVYYALLSKVPDFLRSAIGGAQPNISQGLIRSTEIPLPPLSEQKRIAAILDKADAIRRKRQQAIQLADDLLRAVFLDMFGDPVTNPKEWPVKTLGAITKDWRGGASITPDDFTDSGFPVLHKGAIQKQGKIVVDGSKKTFVSSDFSYRKKSSLIKNNCIAITLRDLVPSGPSIGLMADLSDYDADIYLLSQGAYGFAVEPEIAHAAYLVALSNHDGFRQVFRKISVGSTQIHIRSSDVKSLSLPVPPVKLQSEFGNLRSAVMGYQKKAASVGEGDLLLSLAQKAFSGQM
ncbi:restriction endonuclease subunit S [Pseudomonas syringae]|uniref:restriction endonuclease subunit S n=1 Tax=Pseudomonas TaxID=286 RepID=UPI000CD34AA9|nr:restriction endonuclease subunit S [Pseudomonas syringae]SOP94653.1 hypothetical protein CFBP4215_00110 [Pseudomonas syringae pv. syringae]